MNVSPLALVLALPLFATDLQPQPYLLGAADGYTLWLSDTSLSAHLHDGSSLGMRFPRGRCAISHCNDVFPGIDLDIYRRGTNFEYDWIVAPNADPSAIRLHFTGADVIRVDENGDLVFHTPTGELHHKKPFAYQDINGMRRIVPARFRVTEKGELTFRLGFWNRQYPLVIDPALSFVTGLGGAMPGIDGGDYAQSVALDSTGNIYIAGQAASPDFPLVNPLPLTRTPNSCRPVFAAKISADGKTLLYSTLLANTPLGNACASLSAIAVDTAGNAYITGTLFGGSTFVGTASANGASDVFLVQLDPTGALKAAVTFGGSGADTAQSTALGPDGNLYLAGTTASSDFPVSSGALRTSLSSAQDIFLMKLNPTSLSVIYSTFLAQGSSAAVTADAAGNAYVTATTTSTGWPVTAGVVQPVCAGRTTCADVVAAKIKPDGTALLYATYLGDSGTDTAAGIAVDPFGSAYISGTTNSGDFPTTAGAFVQAFDPGTTRSAQTAFAAKVSPDGSTLTYSTLLNAEGGLTPAGIAIDNTSGDAYIAGAAGAANLSVWPLAIQLSSVPLVCYFSTPLSAPTGEYYCPQSGYLAALNSSGTRLLWGTYLGSGAASAVALDNSGNVVVAGQAIAMRKTAAAPSPGNGAGIVKIAPGGLSSIFSMGVQNAAQFESGMPAPGGLAALYLSGIAVNGTIVAPGLPLPTTLGGVNVLVDDVPAPIVAVAGSGNTSQVNFQVPFEVANGQGPTPHMVEVQVNGQSAFISPQQTAPGIFTLANGMAAIQHSSDYSLDTLQNPVHPGEIVTAYATGLGPVTIPVPSGTGSTGADPIVSGCANFLSTNAGTILYAGLTPGFPGLYQINIQLSRSLASGVDYIYLQSQDCWLGEPPASLYQSGGVAIYVQ